MIYKRLGSTDVNISCIGCGCWAIGGHGYGKTDTKESIEAIQRALEAGINFFDTADVYGFGYSEELLSDALGTKRKDVIIATKVGVNWDQNGKTYKVLQPDHIIQAVENSLQRLKIDCIPLYQIHWHDGKTEIETVMETLVKCRETGKIQYIGCCNLSEELFFNACKIHRIETCQYPYNLVERTYEDFLKNVSAKLGISIFPYSVLGRGIFSAKYTLLSHFGENDTRSSDPNFYGEQYRQNLLIAEQLKEIGERYGKTAAQVAIRWVLEQPYITCALVGVKNPGQVAENIGAIGWSLSQDDIKRLDSIVH